MVQVDEVFDHVDENLNLRIKTTINQGAKDESWGIRDF